MITHTGELDGVQYGFWGENESMVISSMSLRVVESIPTATYRMVQLLFGERIAETLFQTLRTRGSSPLLEVVLYGARLREHQKISERFSNQSLVPA